MSRDVLILACAVSAGVHAALAPEHATFVPAALALGVLAVGLARSPAPLFVDGAIVAYAFAATTGIPLVHPESEPVTGLAVATKAIEALGVLAAFQLKGATRWLTSTATARSLSR